MAQAQPIVMPKFGQTVEESTLVTWRKTEGDKVAMGDILFEIETDKATLEVESFVTGTILKIVVKEGETVPVQATVAFIGNPGDAIPAVVAPPPAAAGSADAPSREPARAAQAPGPRSRGPAPIEQAAAASRPLSPPPAPAAPGRFKISPRAGKLAARKAIDPHSVQGTGPGGRVVEKDILAYLESSGYNKLRISPTALKLAAKENLDILAARDLATSDRILVSDIERALAERPKPMSKLRQVIAQRLTHSYTSTPHFYATVAVDMTELMALRAEAKAKGLAYTVTDFIMEAVILTLKECPDVNSMTHDGKSVIWRSKVHLGLAVSLDKGLVVPVIRNAEDLSLSELHDKAADLAARAREGKLLPDEMTGSTFTISNMGMMDVESFSAIINPGEGAILAVASTVKKPAVRDDKVVVRSMMNITISVDHRILDGAAAVRFVNAVKQKLEDVELWKPSM